MGSSDDAPRKYPTIAVHLWMPLDEREAVKAVAASKGLSANQWARAVLRRAVAEIRRQSPQQ